MSKNTQKRSTENQEQAYGYHYSGKVVLNTTSYFNAGLGLGSINDTPTDVIVEKHIDKHRGAWDKLADR